jgi:N-acetylglucosaminyl-diphospho-decaprenol L-rhamnosyltransferase
MTTGRPDISIIIVNWKSAAFTKQCLRSIYANAQELNCEVIVVENASYDGCDEMLKADYPQAIFLQSATNLGFAGANNLGFDHCTGRNILFLNPDAEIQGTALQTMLFALESIPQAGMAGACLLNSDLTLQTTCVVALPSILNQSLSSNFLRKTFPRWQIWGMRALFDSSTSPKKVEAISGACMLGKREVIEQVGVFSTDYFMYAEDMDLCAKVAKAGWTICYVPQARIVHHAAGSSSSRQESNFSTIMIRESLVRFMQLHRGSRYASLYRGSVAVTSILRLCMLVIVLPIAVFPRGYRFLSRAFSKWFDVLRWSVGATSWVREHKLSRAPGFSETIPATNPGCEAEKA